MKKRFTDVLKFFFFLGIGVLLIWLAVRGKTPEELNNIKHTFLHANYFWIFLSLIVSGLSHYFRALRWKILLEPLDHRPKTSNTFFAVMVGYLANLALPRLGEVTRCGLLNKYEQVPFTEGFGTVIAERALDLVCLILIFFMILGMEFTKISGLANDLIFNSVSNKFNALMQKRMFLFYAGIFIIVIAGAWFYFRKKIRNVLSGKVKGFIKGLWDGLLSVKNVNKPVQFIMHTVLIWLMYVLQVYVCFFAFPETSGLSFVVAMVITVFGSVGVIAVPGGTGVYQAIIIQILTTIYFISENSSFAFAWAVWTSQVILILVLGLVSLILLPLLNKNKTEAVS